MSTLNQNGVALSRILGDALPQGAVSCSTQGDVMWFLIAETGKFVDVSLNVDQKLAVQEAGLFGAFDVEIVHDAPAVQRHQVEGVSSTPKDRLLAAIHAKDKSLEQVWESTDPQSKLAIEALSEGRGLLKQLREVVERNAAIGAVKQAIAELKESGLPVDELSAEVKALESDEKGISEVAAPVVEDMIRMAVPTMGPGAKKRFGVNQAHMQAVGDGADAIREAMPTTGEAKDAPSGTPYAPIDREPRTLFNGKFVRHDKGEYKRVNEERVAFVDEDVRIRFVDKQMDTFQAAIELVASKGWGAIEVTGSDKFRAEAWMHASLAGLEVQGYEPTEKDLARLNAEKTKAQGAPDTNLVESSLRRAQAIAGMNYAEVVTPDPERGRYTGKVTHETPFHVVQEHGKNTAVIHAKKSLPASELNKALEDNAELRVEYCKGGIVHAKAKTKSLNRGVGVER